MGKRKLLLYKNKKNSELSKDFIIGRDKYIKEIYYQFDKVLEGKMGITFVEGKSGIGKTYLVEKSRNLFSSNNGTYLKVKFNKQNKDEYFFIKELLDNLIRSILTLPKEEYEIAKKNFEKALGKDIYLISELSEDGEKIFGQANHKINTKKIQGRRIIKTAVDLIEVASKIFHPLIFFVDDLQWSDNLTLDILSCILKKENSLNIYLISTYRHEFKTEVLKILPDDRVENIIELKEFSLNQTSSYIRRIFKGKEIDNGIFDIIYNFTNGNPLYVDFFLQILKDKELLYKDKEKNKISIKYSDIRKLEIPKNFEKIIKNNLESLEKIEEKLLEIIVCFGGTIEHKILKKSSNIEPKELDKSILKLEEKSLLIIEKTTISIFHDLVNDIVFENLSEDDRSIMYFSIANNLKDDLNEGYTVGEMLKIASFLTKTEIKLLEKDCLYWINFLVKVGKKASKIEMFDTSKKIYILCEELIEKSEIEIDKKFILEFQLSYMEDQYISGETKKASLRYYKLLENYTNEDEKIKIQLKYINFYSYSAQWEKVLELGEEILKSLNFKIDAKKIIKDLILSRIYYRNREIQELNKLKEVDDKRIISILEVLSIMFPAANRIDLNMFTALSLKLSIISKRYGKSPYSTFGYAAFAYILFFVFKDYRNGELLQKTTIELMNQNPYKYNKSTAYALIGTFTYHWTNSFKETIDCLSKSIEAGEEEGEYLFSNYAIVFTIITKYVMGESITNTENYIKNSMTKKERLENYLTRQMYKVYLLHFDILKNGDVERNFSTDKNKIYFHDTLMLNWNMLKVHRLYLEGKIKEAYKLTEKIDSSVWKHKGFILNGLFLFYSTLIRIEFHSNLNEDNKKINNNIIKKSLKKMQKLSGLNEGNHMPRYLLAKAEYKRIIKKEENIDNLYHKAMKISSREKNIHMEAASNLMASKYYKSNKKLSSFYNEEASRLFYKWGANHISENLNPQNKNIQNKSKNIIENIKNEDEDEVEIINIIKGTKKSFNESHISVLKYLHKKFKYRYAGFLYEKNGLLDLKCEKKLGFDPEILEKPVNINFIDYIPVKLIRYSARTEKIVVSEGNKKMSLENHFYSKNDENSGVRICLPLKHKSVLLGICYIELEEKKDDYEDMIYICNWILNEISKNNTKIQNNGKIKRKTSNTLTKREIQIISLISQGLSNNEISEKLFISVGTVRNHLSNAYSKLDVDNRVQAIIESKSRGII